MSLKKAADELLKIADEIEAQADKVTTFVCGSCNHTTTLEKINAKRAEVAKEAANMTVGKITVNDKVSCPACNEPMSYKATEASEKFYFDHKADEALEEQKEEKSETPAEEKKEEKEASIDYDSVKRYQSA